MAPTPTNTKAVGRRGAHGGQTVFNLNDIVTFDSATKSIKENSDETHSIVLRR